MLVMLLQLGSSFAQASLVQAAGPSRDGSSGPALEIEDLGLAVQAVSRPIAGRVFAQVAEATAHADLNADGDLSDLVVHVVDLAGGAPLDLGYAGVVQFDDVPFFTANGYAPMSVDEARQGGRDLNGDGDATDQVLFTVELSTLRVTNLGLTTGGAVAVEGRWALLDALEPFEARDLNGDGDALDELVFALDFESGARTLLGPGRGAAIEGGRAFVVEREWLDGHDRNGDGDALDALFSAYDLAGGAREPLKVLATRNGSWRTAGHTLFSSPSERDLNRDLNGDGDRLDVVLHAFDLLDGRARNLGLPSHSSVGVSGPWILTFLLEGTAHLDFNRDGDTLDTLRFTYDETRQQLTPHLMDTEGNLRLSAPEDLALDIVSEAGDDWNGDGDGLDRVPQLYDFRLRRRSRLPYALGVESDGLKPATLFGDQVSLLVSERGQGRDLNGDGDRNDDVLHVYEPRSARAASTALATRGIFLVKQDFWLYWPGPGCVLFPVSEAGQGGVDLNGDGDALDDVLHVLVAHGGVRTSLTNLGLGISGFRILRPEVHERWLGLPLDESGAGRDLDGDGFVLAENVPMFHHLPSGTTFSLGAEGEILAMDEQHALVNVAGDSLGDGLARKHLERVTFVER